MYTVLKTYHGFVRFPAYVRRIDAQASRRMPAMPRRHSEETRVKSETGSAANRKPMYVQGIEPQSHLPVATVEGPSPSEPL